MFSGTHTPKLDDKGRLFLPAKFRDELTEGLVITRGQERSLDVRTKEDFAEFTEKFTNASQTDARMRAYGRMLFALASEQVPDKQGRVSLTPELRRVRRPGPRRRRDRRLRPDRDLGAALLDRATPPSRSRRSPTSRKRSSRASDRHARTAARTQLNNGDRRARLASAPPTPPPDSRLAHLPRCQKASLPSNGSRADGEPGPAITARTQHAAGPASQAHEGSNHDERQHAIGSAGPRRVRHEVRDGSRSWPSRPSRPAGSPSSSPSLVRNYGTTDRRRGPMSSSHPRPGPARPGRRAGGPALERPGVGPRRRHPRARRPHRGGPRPVPAGPRRRRRPRRARARAWPASGWRRTPAGTTLVHAVYDEIPDVLAELGIDAGRRHPVRPRRLLDAARRRASAASPTPRTPRWTCGWTTPRGPTAADVLNTYPAGDLARILRTYGEEKFARQIARAIVRARETEPFTGSARLVELLRDTIPAPARRTGGTPGQAHLPGAAHRGQRRARRAAPGDPGAPSTRSGSAAGSW